MGRVLRDAQGRDRREERPYASGCPQEVHVAARVSLVGAVIQGALGAVAEQRRVGGGVVVAAAASLL